MYKNLADVLKDVCEGRYSEEAFLNAAECVEKLPRTELKRIISSIKLEGDIFVVLPLEHRNLEWLRKDLLRALDKRRLISREDRKVVLDNKPTPRIECPFCLRFVEKGFGRWERDVVCPTCRRMIRLSVDLEEEVSVDSNPLGYIKCCP